MNRNELRDYCLSMTGAVEEFPFGFDVAVFKVKGKMFALLPVVTDPMTISLKSDPIEAVMLREMYQAVQPGYHQNKKHWNTVELDGSIPDREVYSMIDHSYECVVRGLKRSEREQLEKL